MPPSQQPAFHLNQAAQAAALENFVHLSEHGVLVCREHGYAVGSLSKHVSTYHAYPGDVRQAVLSRFSGVRLTSPDSAPLPASYGPPIECLALPQRALQCGENGCGLITVSRVRIAQHCNQAHGWKSTRDQREHWSQVMVQSFSQVHGKQRYFIVADDSVEGPRPPQLGDATPYYLSDVDEIMDEFGVLEARHRKALEKLDEEVANTDQTGWWKKTGWVEHLKGSNLKHLSHAARLPAKDEATLCKARELVEGCVEQSVKGLMNLPMELRRWLKSAQIAEVDQRPMGRLQNESSQDIYANYWVRMICYCLRVLQSEEASAKEHEEEDAFSDGARMDESDDEEEGEAPTPEQRREHDDMYDARRLFPWRDGQKEIARRLLWSVASDEPVEQRMGALLELCETFIFQKVYGDVFASPLVHFVAVLGIDQENSRLRTGNDFSYMLAGLVYCARVVALEILVPGEQRSAQGEMEFEAFLQRRREYLADGTMSPMSTIISLLAYGKHLAMNHGNAGSVFWEQGDRVMRLHSSRLVMDKFREMVKRAIGDAEHVLWNDLMWKADRFELDLDGLTDDFTFRRRGSYFVNNAQNALDDAWQWMVGRMKRTKEGRRLRSGKRWNRRRVIEYLRRVDQFLKLLLFCVHVTGGQPKRGSEMLAMRFKNGLLQDRNAFVLDGMMMLVSRYYKSQSQWDVPKAVPSFLPWRVGQLMAVYLAYVQPFAERLSVAVGYGSGWGEYIWADANGPWETPKLTAILQRRTGQDLGVSLGTLEYRHVAVGIGRKFVGDEFARGYKSEIGEVEEPEVEAEDPLEQSAGRGSAVGMNRYAVSKDIVRHLSQRNIDTFRPLSESWHRFLGLASRKGDGEKGKRVHGADGPVASAQKRAKTTTWKTPTRKTAIASGLLTPAASSTTIIPSPSPSLGEKCSASIGKEPSPPRKTGFGQSERERAVRKALRMAQSNEIEYKSPQQQEALERIIDGTDPALAVVLPTGGGKTLLFTTPACLEDPGVTIVVVPYRQLISETIADVKASGIECIEWTHRVEDPATMVVVSADRLTDGFFGYASLLASKGLVRRVFVDECHLALTAHSWRSRLAELARVQTIEAPLIMLTATLPVHMECDLEVTMATAGRLEWIRAPTARATTKYVVRASVKDGELRQEAVKLCKKQLGLLKHGSKMVVYCRTKSECETMAGELDCGFFYSGSVNNDKELERWKKEGGCIVATSALGTGVNYPGIRMVVHAGMPYGLIDFAQESGRAGRGGEDVDSLVLVEKGWEGRERAKRRAKRQEWTRDEMEALKFVNTECCRRLVLAEYFDDKEPLDCISGEMARCDRCGSGVTDWERSQRNIADERGAVTDTLDQMAGGCAVCWIRVAIEGDGDWLHDGKACRRRELRADDGSVIDMGEQACDVFREQVRYLDGRTCFSCGIIQKLCNTREEEQGRCQWPRIAVPVLRAAMASTMGRNIVRQAGYGGEMDDWDAYALWLGQPHRLRLWKELVSNSMVVIKEFLVYCRQETKNRVDVEVDGASVVESAGDGTEAMEAVEVVAEGRNNGDEGSMSREVATLAPVESPYVEKKQARAMEVVVNVEELRQMVDEWKHLCVLCKIHGRFSSGHRHWQECKGPAQERQKMEEAIEVLRGVRFADFSQCKWCNRSQAMCELWQRKTNASGRVVFKRQPGRDCVYGASLLEAAAGLLAFRTRDGIEAVRTTDPSLGRLREEMGRKLRRGEVEFSGMFMYFFQWS